MKISLKIFLFCITVSSFVGCDQVTKNLAKEHLIDGRAISYLNNTFVLKYAENTGAFLSLGNDLSDSISIWIFIIIPVIFLISLTVYVILKSKELNWMKLLGFSLILAGGIGNIIDRIIFDRRVTDFMIVGIQNIRSGIFNFADLYVTIGVLALIFLYNDKKVTPEGQKST